MKSRRDAILMGAKAAARLHLQLGIRKHVESGVSNVDVFGTIVRQGIPLVFRPLEGLLGAYLPSPGIIITTQRPLSVQRWTAAHELGHAVMQHTMSLDDESLLTRSAASQLTYDPAEVAADAFATHFLLPRWLFVAQAARHKWRRKDLLNPVVIYQLSLRAGASYQATCVALYRHQLIERKVFEHLFVAEVKAIKRQILADYELDDWYPDVWLLTEADEGLVIEGDIRDAFVLRLNENSGAGYLWNIDALKAAGFLLFRDQRLTLGGNDHLGGPVERVVGARPGNSHYGQVALKQMRPWQTNAAPISRFSFTFDLRGKESGRPRVERHSLAAA